ncbi:MAG: Formamidase [Alphaproteobacteria bacterium MarineAlpha5_Bin9]|nr:MAG: Formamidase [Alphaproteobacteria bacterium MarineAlpha5_Bin9]|tara:strand:- start:6731 stop:7678 length:948 start_codon:yes stop_codon:yes gene_type:complete
MTSIHSNHTIHSKFHHFGWDNSIEPVKYVKSGETVEIETVDSSGGQITINSTIKDIEKLDFSKVNPVSGPIYVENANVGDVIEIEILQLKTSGWGWTAIIPGFGLLNDDFKNADLNIWKYDKNEPKESLFSNLAKIPLKPFIGTIGLALEEKGNHSIVPPRKCGGNLDIKDMSVGTILRLPVQVKGGLLSLGDTHAAQGDGEVCGTAIESPMIATIKINLLKNKIIKEPQFETFNSNYTQIDNKGYYVTTGIGPDLFESSKNSLKSMINLLIQKQNISENQAYMLSSVCADLRISEIVDAPNWVISCYFPKSIFI